MLMNWMNQICQLISDGNRSNPFFHMEKNKEDGEGKNKVVTHRLAFHFSLKTVVKQGSFQKEKKSAFTNIELNRSC